MSKAPSNVIQPGWVRITHWVIVLAILMMVTSGWQIYNASPIFGSYTFPASVTLGGWLGGALLWHFAAMWLFFAAVVMYVILNILTGRAKRRFWPLSIKSFFSDAWAALRGKLGHDNLARYNAVQKFAYLAVVLDFALIIVSGLVVWKNVQFPLLRELMGGYDTARIVHFCAMAFIILFFIVHIAMVALVPRSLLLMIRGR